MYRLRKMWHNMRDRCIKKDNISYCYYGGRGVNICSEWKYNFEAFKEWALSNGYSDKKIFALRDPNKNYCPENCHFTDHKSRCNRRSNTILYNFNGELKSITEICEITGAGYQKVYQRIRSGKSLEEALL